MTVLFITSRYPYPLLKGDQVRAYHQITELAKRGHKITLISFDNGSRNTELEQRCAATYLVKPVDKQDIVKRMGRLVFSDQPLQLAFFYSPEMVNTIEHVMKTAAFDVAVVQLSRMGDYLPFLQKAKIPVVLDLIDSLAMNIDLKGQKSPFPLNLLWRMESKRLFNYETRAASSVAAATVVSEKDKEYLNQASIYVNPNGVSVSSSNHESPREDETLMFHGNMSYYPNVEGAQFLVRDIMPRVWQEKPTCKVLLVGANPSKKVSALASENVVVTGYVEDVKPFLRTSTLGVYPILRATGIQNKILEAMTEGLPVITTPTVAEGIKEGVTPQHFYSESDAEKLAIKIVQLLNDSNERQRLALAAKELILNSYTWEIQVTALEKLMLQSKA
jgi:polysaccharide biosynthesis protein PslH